MNLRRLVFLIDMWAGGPILTPVERVFVFGLWICVILVVLWAVFGILCTLLT
jgi:hypothetical protein